MGCAVLCLSAYHSVLVRELLRPNKPDFGAVGAFPVLPGIILLRD